MTPTADKTVREIALENPASVPIFESLGIDYCCGGKRSLKDACLRANVAEESVLNLLEKLETLRSEESEPWTQAPLADLTAHIVDSHHAFVRSESARLGALAGKVCTRHEQTHPELTSIREVFAALAQELSTHMLKEEQVLFPWLNSMDAAARAGKMAPPAFFGSVRNPIAHMLTDHDDASVLLGELSRLSGRYQAPACACPAYKALYDGLEEFERDLHRHVHLENNILFPRAIEMEKALNS